MRLGAVLGSTSSSDSAQRCRSDKRMMCALPAFFARSFPSITLSRRVQLGTPITLAASIRFSAIGWTAMLTAGDDACREGGEPPERVRCVSDGTATAVLLFDALIVNRLRSASPIHQAQPLTEASCYVAGWLYAFLPVHCPIGFGLLPVITNGDHLATSLPKPAEPVNSFSSIHW